jgi:diguanylate cyclase (GGDEF)-like protein
VSLGEEPSGAAAASLSRQPIFVADVHDQAAAADPVVQETGVVSMHFEPILGEPDPTGVLALGWNERTEALSAHVAGAVRTLAAEAAIALERAALLASLKESARTDDLTGLPNRRAWEERLPRELAGARRDGQSVCVVMLDLDRFKHFNDGEGHQAGDRLLKLCAASWASQLRATDVLVRYGGEGFSLVLTGCSLEDARLLVERLRDVMPEGQTVSAGIAAWDGWSLPSRSSAVPTPRSTRPSAPAGTGWSARTKRAGSSRRRAARTTADAPETVFAEPRVLAAVTTARSRRPRSRTVTR